MGILSGLFGKKQENDTAVSGGSNIPTTSSGVQLLDLNKGDILDLNKYSTSLTRVRAAAGWDVNQGAGSDFDLDLCAYLCSKDEVVDVVYYGDKRSQGIYLDQDNLTGSGDGDDENIHIELNNLRKNVDKIILAVVIYNAASRRQKFKDVQNAYVRLIDESNGNEICRFRLTENGEDNTAVIFASLSKDNSGWSFKAIGTYSKNSIESLRSNL